ncbi:D-alanyl-D-alanine carboxypeptidase/D-alanyl-D-alanine-endopeptidase [Streptomyces sp. NPDC101118]|uniref:D-alanyl-D-alanine carboxypeptidase/D-alanyl-D-alanine endopeptidase n=1 Tax=Streptomyces sp. NPDC101118 TaxID=3366109 RepID=UPI00382F78F9
MPLTRTWQLAAGSAVAGLALAVGAVAAAGPWDSGQRKAERDWAAAQGRTGGADHGLQEGPGKVPAGLPQPVAAPSAPGVLQGLGTAAVTPAGATALARALAPLLGDAGLGTTRTACVVDVATGRLLYGSDEARPMTPASTTKIATALAVLAARGAEYRIETRVLADPDARRVVLIGGGDPTLTARTPRGAGGPAAGTPGPPPSPTGPPPTSAKAPATATPASPRPLVPAPGPAAPPAALRASGGPGATGGSLVELADQTARQLRARAVTSVRVDYDTGLYSGPATHPIGAGNENIAPVSALMADEGRLDGSAAGPAPRAQDPAAAAARTFAGLLADRGVRVTGTPAPGRPAPKATPVAATASAPLSVLVERMLTESDNDLAEALARQTALAAGQPASFEGAERAVTTQLRGLGVDLRGARFADGSGLSRQDRVSAAQLTALLARAADPARAELRPVLTGLPVAGFTGTLRARNADDSPAAGLLRAKTGTLKGVNSLAGTVVDPTGRLLAFAFLADGTPGPGAAQPALDRLAAAVATTTQ